MFTYKVIYRKYVEYICSKIPSQKYDNTNWMRKLFISLYVQENMQNLARVLLIVWKIAFFMCQLLSYEFLRVYYIYTYISHTHTHTNSHSECYTMFKNAIEEEILEYCCRMHCTLGLGNYRLQGV